MAVFLLPQEMNAFFLSNLDQIEAKSIDADRRKHSVKDESCRHYDIDHYSVDSPFVVMPKSWRDAVLKFTEDTLKQYGILPWHIQLTYLKLVTAMEEKNSNKIIYYAADLGHYISDAHVPLHTTLNYDGQLTNQKGIHAFWESRLPEFFASNYNFVLPKVNYLNSILMKTWEVIKQSHLAKDSVLLFEKKLNTCFEEDEIFAFEQKGQVNARVYSRS